MAGALLAGMFGMDAEAGLRRDRAHRAAVLERRSARAARGTPRLRALLEARRLAIGAKAAAFIGERLRAAVIGAAATDWPEIECIRDNGILLVSDEVITGFWLNRQWSLRDDGRGDLMTFAKGATSARSLWRRRSASASPPCPPTRAASSTTATGTPGWTWRAACAAKIA